MKLRRFLKQKQKHNLENKFKDVKPDRKAKNYIYAFCFLLSVLYLLPAQAQDNSLPQSKIIVNSDRDGSIQPDSELTLREAIFLANGMLSLEPSIATHPEYGTSEPAYNVLIRAIDL
jgi:hypothetical protein